MRVMEGVGVLGSSLVGVEGTVGVCEREEELERVGRVIARRKRSFSGIVRIYAWFQLLCSLLVLRGVVWAVWWCLPSAYRSFVLAVLELNRR